MKRDVARRIAYHGTMFTVAFATDKLGACPAGKFFDALDLLDKAKLMALFRVAGDHGQFHNPEKFGDLGGCSSSSRSGFECRLPTRRTSAA